MNAMFRRPVRVCLAVGLLAIPWILGMSGCPKPPPQLTGPYVSATPCAQCHANIHTDWSATLHAHAMEALQSVGQQDNPGCQPCHTTGYGQTGGFVSLMETPELEGVQCEDCHGPAREHVMNVTEVSLRPVVPITADVCGKCHTTDTYPQFPKWQQSAHAVVTSVPAGDFTNGQLLSVCGPCHSGDYRFEALILGNAVPADLLKGVPRDKQNAVTCVICHDPHKRTGNAVNPDDARDFQLRYPEVKTLTPTDTISVLTNPGRYPLCGQCHHTRGKTWTATDRGPHHSIQYNLYTGEMPMPAGQENTPLAENTKSVHRFVPAQCATCHMFREASPSQFAPPIAGHNLVVNVDACDSATGCHPTSNSAVADKTALQKEVQTRLDGIAKRLGPVSTWGYSEEGGPADQSKISDTIKQVRFLYSYIVADGSLGVHNPSYVRTMLTQAEDMLTGIGK
jgi:hypothetical protein